MEEEGDLQLIPEINIFKEIMVELIKTAEIDLEVLRKEKKEMVMEQTYDFQLQDMIMEIFEEEKIGNEITKILIRRKTEDETVIFHGIEDENGRKRDIRCSNVEITFLSS